MPHIQQRKGSLQPLAAPRPASTRRSVECATACSNSRSVRELSRFAEDVSDESTHADGCRAQPNIERACPRIATRGLTASGLQRARMDRVRRSGCGLRWHLGTRCRCVPGGRGAGLYQVRDLKKAGRARGSRATEEKETCEFQSACHQEPSLPTNRSTVSLPTQRSCHRATGPSALPAVRESQASSPVSPAAWRRARPATAG